MRQIKLIAFAIIVAFLLVPTIASAALVRVLVDGADITSSLTGTWTQNPENGRWWWSIQEYTTTDYTITNCDAWMDDDPLINYALGVTNTSALPHSFSFVFGTPMSPSIQNPSIAGSSFGGSVTDGAVGDETVTLTAMDPSHGQTDGSPSEVHVPTVSANNGVTLTNLGLDLREDFSFNSSFGNRTANIGVPPEIGSVPSGGPWNWLQIDVNFQLSGGNDAAAMTGSVEIAPVPIPGAVWLFGSGLIGLLGFRRKFTKS